jgi:hypothetical protein
MAHRAQPKTHRHVERGADFYATPPAAVQALLGAYQPPRRIWEPCCGDGAIVQVLRAAGHEVVAHDLHDWGCPDSAFGLDFMQVREAPPGCECIIANFPYKRVQQFAEHALTLVPQLVMLARLALLESQRRSQLIEESGLRRILVFRNRLPMMHRYNWTGPRNSSSTAYAWFCWERGYNDMPTIQRITCPTEPTEKTKQAPPTCEAA